jgi:hypothetical protein
MAESSNNVLTVGNSGSVGRQITFWQRAGKTIMGKKRMKATGEPTAPQAVIRQKFLAAVTYANGVKTVAATRAAYKAVARAGQSWFSMAVRDAATPPTVSKIDTTNYHGAVGDAILITATDDFKVTGVSVSILSAAGAVLEQGKAVQQENVNEWLYTATVANAATAGSKITAVASDLPGNTGTLSVTL